MAYAHTVAAPRSIEVSQTAPRSQRGLFHRLLDAVEAHSHRKAEAQIARYVGPGHKFTDESEREIERRLFGHH